MVETTPTSTPPTESAGGSGPRRDDPPGSSSRTAIDAGGDVLRALLTRGRAPAPSRPSTGARATTTDLPTGAIPGGREHRLATEEARRLRRAERDRAPMEPLSRRRPGLSLQDAYLVQWCGAALRVDEGARVVGHKVGLTSQAMRQQVGIDEPDSGILLDTMAIACGGTLRVGELVAPRIEAEIAFRLGDDLHGADVDEGDARAVIAEVFLALEVIDSRFTLDGLTLADSVADNAACARFVLGAAVPAPTWDLRAEELTVRVDDTPAASGKGRAVLGDPIRSLVWLARRLAAFDARLAAGDVVLAGAVHAGLPLAPGTTVSAASPHLPPVTLHIA
ncbi:2-keto-4-pentenoate hydratase [Embleya sp. NPDC059237]|uniref:2-keto-4-pentenoate hydratase n=1 Tax=Embleya sp. NPDC059237 TaxID=3346784 RepID=UPI00367982BF